MLGKITKIVKEYKRKELTVDGLIRAAVLVPILEKNDQLHILFTKRTENVEIHKGQISFPGGHVDKTDKDLMETALRETQEEIGISPSKIEILGAIDDSNTSTGFIVTPYVGLLKSERNYIIEEAEIQRIIEVPLTYLMDNKKWHKEEFNHKGRIYIGEYILYGNDKIWGATAKMLRQFLNLLSDK